MLHQANVRVLAVAGRLHPFHGQPGRFIGRTKRIVTDANGNPLHAVYDAMDDGEVVPYDVDVVKALQCGDLQLVEKIPHARHDHAPGPKPRASAVATPAEAPALELTEVDSK